MQLLLQISEEFRLAICKQLDPLKTRDRSSHRHFLARLCVVSIRVILAIHVGHSTAALN